MLKAKQRGGNRLAGSLPMMVETEGDRNSHPAACPLCGLANTERIYTRTAYQQVWHLARCSSCGLHFTDPPPTQREMHSFYEGDYHTELQNPAFMDRAFGPKYRRYLNFVSPHLRANAATLDVGCATGLFPKMLKDAGYQAEGIELNTASAAWGRENYRVPIQEGTLEDLLVSSRKFDLISMTDVLEHTLSPPAEVHKVHGLLNEGGHFLVTFPDILSPSSRYLRALSKLIGREWAWTTCHIPQHTWEFSYATALRLFRKGGFELVAFRRSQTFSFELSKFGLLCLPANLAALSGVDRYAGNQMEFLLKRVS
jgi:2-polyprenyl-3-methyl-5-hydroxy-6-metoxy-1,4-benzoquinol methylase